VASYYVDTSALVKYYVGERGTVWVKNILDPVAGHLLFTVSLTGVELVAAVSRKGRMGELDTVGLAQAITAVRSDWLTWAQVLVVHSSLLTQAMDLVERHGLRGYDAVHLAGALEVAALQQKTEPTLTFISADDQQRRAAAAEGLSVEDPNAHP